jgi:hypothetical protein
MKKIILITLLFELIGGLYNSVSAQTDNRQLNISLFIDLSDRIDPQKYPAFPEHFQRDTANILSIVEHFKKEMEIKRPINAKGKLRVFFDPLNSPMVNTWINDLNIDLSKFTPDGRKVVYREISEKYMSTLKNIYQFAIDRTTWPGSAIWRFFKDKIDYCIDRDSSYRNILIIITDGYLYDANVGIPSIGNRHPNLYSTNIGQFRTNTKWKEEIIKQNFGLIDPRNDLNTLEILVLGISHEKYPIDADIIKFVLGRWFNEMNVQRFEIYESDVPVNTKIRIEEFINNNNK